MIQNFSKVLASENSSETGSMKVKSVSSCFYKSKMFSIHILFTYFRAQQELRIVQMLWYRCSCSQACKVTFPFIAQYRWNISTINTFNGADKSSLFSESEPSTEKNVELQIH